MEAELEIDNPKKLLDEAMQETEEKKEKTLKENPYYLGDLVEKRYETDGTGVYRWFHISKDFQTLDEFIKFESYWH